MQRTDWWNGPKTGVCIEHRSLRNTLFTMEIPDIIYQVPAECNIWCKKKHIFKTLHFNLDENGRCTVSPHVLETMREKQLLGPFKAMREVAPEPTFIGLGRADRPFFVISHEHGEQRMYAKDNPGRVNGSDLTIRILEGEASGELSV